MHDYVSPKVGDKVYIQSRCHISRGSDDVHGGVATVSKVEKQMSAGKMVDFIEVIELPGRCYNWEQVLVHEQDKLREEFGDTAAHPDPDIDRPFFEEGDTFFRSQRR